MKQYKVTVNGTAYEITLEEIDASSAAAAAPAASSANASAGEGESVNAPMPGNILDIKVNVGDKVKKGDVLIILEAMKMENEITAPCDGTVKSIGVTKGGTAETGTVLCVIG